MKQEEMVPTSQSPCPLARIKSKSCIVPIAMTWLQKCITDQQTADCSSSAESKPDPGSPAATQAFHSYSKPDSQPCYIYSFVYRCVSMCACGCTREWKSGKGPEKAAVSVGTRGSQQGDWLYKQTFTTLWLQQSPLETQNVGQKQAGWADETCLRHFIVTVKSETVYKQHTHCTLLWPTDLKPSKWVSEEFSKLLKKSWCGCGISQRLRKKHQSMHPCTNTLWINLNTLGMFPNHCQCCFTSAWVNYISACFLKCIYSMGM